MTSTADELLREISRCPNVLSIIAGNTRHPCAEIVLSQSVVDIEDFQVPEPWNGDIRLARLLYLSSNPSISDVEEYPVWKSHNTLIEDFFVHRFGGGLKPWVIEGKRALAKDGTYLRATPYWSEIANRSAELFGRAVTPGVDYALTEIVHCKSRSMIGVDSAITECGERYLSRVLQASEATVVASIGSKAGDLLRKALHETGTESIIGPREIAGKKRLVLFLAAPGSSKPRIISRVLTPEEAQLVGDHLSDR